MLLFDSFGFVQCFSSLRPISVPSLWTVFEPCFGDFDVTVCVAICVVCLSFIFLLSQFCFPFGGRAAMKPKMWPMSCILYFFSVTHSSHFLCCAPMWAIHRTGHNQFLNYCHRFITHLDLKQLQNSKRTFFGDLRTGLRQWKHPFRWQNSQSYFEPVDLFLFVLFVAGTFRDIVFFFSLLWRTSNV